MHTSGLKKIYYLSSTHWDREWYRSFQGFRYRLVKVVDKVIDVLETDPQFKSFILDGQTVVLDDYTKIEPEKLERLTSLLTKDRIIAGPWYVMPDEFLVSGESLVRNLIIGHRLARRYGAKEPMKYGYLCDVFGHIAQMPQILNGFGIYGALVGRGTNVHTTDSHFLWQSPDGSCCTTFKVPEECGYGTFWLDVWAPYAADSDEEGLVERACRYIDREAERSELPFVVLMDGMDHSDIHEKAPWLARRLEEIYHCPVVFESLDKIPEDLSTYITRLPVKEGELNETAKRCVEHNMLITYTLSSRYDLKKANDHCQTLLEKWAMPCAVLSAWNGTVLRKAFLDEAYRQLIKCHAHDSICGCSIDRVHRDMHYRFRQSEAIAEELIGETVLHLSDLSRVDGASEEYVLSILNPLAFQRKEVIKAEIWFLPGYSHRYCEQAQAEYRNAFRLLDRFGREVSYAILEIQKGKYVEMPGQGKVLRDCYTIAFSAELEACGETEYRIVPSDKPVRCLEGLATGFYSAENNSVSLEISERGTVTLTDKLSGKVYQDLLGYVDDADIGDGWFYGKPVNDRVISSRGFPASVELLYDHRDICAFQIISYLRLPEGIVRDPDHWIRKEEWKELKIRSVITFYKESRYIDVASWVDNSVKDHRLRLLLPTGLHGGAYQAGQAFTFVERKTGIDPLTADWKECEKYEKACDGILLKRDVAGDGLAFLSEGGLHECAALNDGTLAITLFRSFSATVSTNGEPDGELQGMLAFRYRIQLLSREDTLADLVRSADALRAGVRFTSFPANPGSALRTAVPFLTLKSRNTAVSVIKPPEDGEPNCAIIRLVNYSNQVSRAELSCAETLTCVFETDLLEQNQAALPVSSPLYLELPPWKIKTLRMIWK